MTCAACRAPGTSHTNSLDETRVQTEFNQKEIRATRQTALRKLLAHLSSRVAMRSPWIFAAIVVIKLARMFWAKRIDKPPHGSHALVRQQRRLGAAHIGPDPSGINQNAVK